MPDLDLHLDRPTRPIFAQGLSCRGYGVTYRQGENNRCPGCGGRSWYVGRTGAECAFCNTFLPFGGESS